MNLLILNHIKNNNIKATIKTINPIIQVLYSQDIKIINIDQRKVKINNNEVIK